MNAHLPRIQNGVRGPTSINPSMPNPGANVLLQQKLLEAVTFLINAEPMATNLSNALANLPQAFRPRTAVSSNTSLLQVVSFSWQNNTLSDKNMVIQQLAANQKNEGKALESEAIIVAGGDHEFEIEMDGKVHLISFAAEGEVTHEAFQGLMAQAINNANLGITASVTVKSGKSTLTLETNTTGRGAEGEPRFTIRDVTGDAIKLTGVDNIAQQAQNAIFTVNGERQENAANTVDLGNGLVVRLIGTSEESVGIYMGQNKLAMVSTVQQVVNSFNSLLETAHLNNRDRNTRILIRELQNAARFSRRGLERIGISITHNGYLSIDENKMNAAMQDGRLEQFFAGSDGRRHNAFVDRLNRITTRVADNPMRHVSPNVSRLPGFSVAMTAARNADNNSTTTPSPFDAYWPDDFFNIFFNMQG